MLAAVVMSTCVLVSGLSGASAATFQSAQQRGWGSSPESAVAMLRGHAATFCFGRTRANGFDFSGLEVRDDGPNTGLNATRYQATAYVTCNGQNTPPSQSEMSSQARMV